MASNNVNLCVVLTFLIACISSANGIAGGKPATQPGHFEYVAAYTWRAHSHTYGCAGAIVSKHYILTLASKALNIIDLNATIYVGAQKLGPHAETAKFYDVYPHPQYFKDPVGYDIALVKTVDPIASTPIDLPTEDFPFKRDIPVRVSGYGATTIPDSMHDDRVDMGDTLMELDCKTDFPDNDKFIETKSKRNHGLSSNDAGDPLVIVKDGKLALVGIATGATFRDTYIKVFNHLGWIKAQLQK